ncbi:phosphoglycerate kinase [Candidatus Woesearchaeota archaeon]|nr:phosphoglycerate kinase [Candidatus Woesearchaeota archaeon]
MNYFSLDEFNDEGKHVLVRVDYNLPVDEEGNVIDDQRIKLTIPTLKYLLSLNSKIIVMTHFKRPKGKVVEELRVDKIAEALENNIGIKVKKLNYSTGAEVENAISDQQDEIIFLENIQFEQGEVDNTEKFGKALASLADVFVLDAFGQAHRAYGSLCQVEKFIPSFAGKLLENEMDKLDMVTEDPELPVVGIIGGAKKDKIELIKTLLDRGFNIIIGGMLANTFIKANGIDVKGSKYDENSIDLAKELMSTYRDQITLPVDAVCGSEFDANAEVKVTGLDSIPDGWLIMDIGPVTRQMYKDKLSEARTIFWGGPIGVFEWDNFAEGTKSISDHIAGLNCIKIIGGGESAAAVNKFGHSHEMTHVSSGGGACLKYLSGESLPALKALEENYERYSE